VRNIGVIFVQDVSFNSHIEVVSGTVLPGVVWFF